MRSVADARSVGVRSVLWVAATLARHVPLLWGMPTFKSHEDIDAWRLATELKEWVFRIIKRSTVWRDFKFCDDIRRSARSAPANIAEGFWRGKGRPGRPRENARFVSYALGSLGETKNHLRDAFVEKYLDEQEYSAIVALNVRALSTCQGWHDFLMSCRDPDDRRQPPSRKPPGTNRKPNEPK